MNMGTRKERRKRINRGLKGSKAVYDVPKVGFLFVRDTFMWGGGNNDRTAQQATCGRRVDSLWPRHGDSVSSFPSTTTYYCSFRRENSHCSLLMCPDKTNENSLPENFSHSGKSGSGRVGEIQASILRTFPRGALPNEHRIPHTWEIVLPRQRDLIGVTAKTMIVVCRYVYAIDLRFCIVQAASKMYRINAVLVCKRQFP
jgi:hypothetical protein